LNHQYIQIRGKFESEKKEKMEWWKKRNNGIVED
jgi:hypothetical protein